tara:strand:- start:1395 stop:1589 length:195 start_codon:yes stop_codon:yes gene_type:complete
MGKTFRRGGAERGYSSPGKSLRDKRQRGTNRSEFRDDKNIKDMKYHPKENIRKYQTFTEEELWG